MELAALRRRVWASMLAAAAGWLAAMAVTMPMQWYAIYSDADRAWSSLFMGTGIWLGWTLAIASGAWLLGGLPAAVLLGPRWVLRHRRLFLAGSGSLAWFVVLFKFKTWKLLIPDHTLGPWLFSVYSLLMVVFALVAATVYLRLVARITGGAPTD